MEAKFNDFSNDPAIQGGSLIANIANSMVESLIAIDIEKNGESSVTKWQKWREIIPERREYKIAPAKLKSESNRLERQHSEQLEYMHSLFTSFRASEEIINNLLNSAQVINKPTKRS
jgi:hypothetical protein